MIKIIRHPLRARHLKENGDSILSDYVYVGRPTTFGNPYSQVTNKETLAPYVVKTVDEAVKRYHQWFYNRLFRDIEFQQAVQRLVNQYQRTGCLYLGCWCQDELTPSPRDHNCHATVIREYIIHTTNMKNLWARCREQL